MNKTIDVLGLGYAAVDDLLYVDAYPPADGKTPVRRRKRHCGGLTATALVAAARLGCRCAYAGTLGEDEHSRFVVARFHEEGVDVTHVRRRADARPVRSTIVVDQRSHTRAILYDTAGVIGADTTWPAEDVIRAAKVLLVDNCGVEGMIRAAEIARDAGASVVADFENAEHPSFPRLLGLVDHLILSRDFALSLTGQTELNAAMQSLWTAERRAVVVTCGKEGCWCLSSGKGDRRLLCEAPGTDRRLVRPFRQKAPVTFSAGCERLLFHQPALAVEVVDTTGCGDVFHGAYAAALVHGCELPAALRFATVAAGMKATRPGGQLGIPTRAVVEAEIARIENCG
jgi:sulfofructose kinase